MEITSKILLSATCTLGGGCAVIIPVTLSGREKVAPVKDSAKTKLVQVELRKCVDNEDSQYPSISFGSDPSGRVCWRSENLDKSGEYTNFLATQWNRSELDWNKSENHERWTQQCFVTPSKWAILSNSGKAQYLGFCDLNEESQTPFIKKVREYKEGTKKDEWEISVCNRDCWVEEPELLETSTKVFKEEKNGSWARVEFYN